MDLVGREVIIKSSDYTVKQKSEGFKGTIVKMLLDSNSYDIEVHYSNGKKDNSDCEYDLFKLEEVELVGETNEVTLTTAQMIDKLKVGQEAECVQTSIEDWKNSVVEAKQHSWNWTLATGKSEEFYLSEKVRECKWRILAKYVSFEEAITALKEGKTIYFVDNLTEYKIVSPAMIDDYLDSHFYFSELIEGKWTIED